MAGLYGGGDVLQSKTMPCGVVELTQDSRGLWLYRVRSESGVPHWRYAKWSALGYRKPDDAYAAVERAEREG